MARIPPVNAIVTEIRGAGSAEDYDFPATPGPIKWTGSAPAYHVERLLMAIGSGSADQLVVTRLAIPDSLAAVEPGDEITFAKAGETHTRTVRSIEERSDFGYLQVHFADD